MSGLKAFVLWSVVGALYGLAVLSLMSIGIFILAVAIVITVIAVRRLEVWPAILGVALGPAAALVRLGSSNLGLRRCGPGEQAHMLASGSGSGSALTGSFTAVTRVEGCIETNLQVLMWSGVALAVATFALYFAARYGRPTAGGPPEAGHAKVAHTSNPLTL